jgi:hypothetical protein
MATIDGEIVIGRPVDVVFDYVADQRNEPQYNPQMVRAEKITAGPVGKGTRFRSAVAARGRTAEMLIECTGSDRPRLLPPPRRWPRLTSATRSGSSQPPPAPGCGGRGRCGPSATRLAGPLITWLCRRQEQRIWASLKAHLEAAPTAGNGGRARAEQN